VIEEIYEELSLSKNKITRFGLLNGYLGLSVFYYLYGMHTGNKSCIKESAILFDQAMETINMHPINYALDFTDLGVVSQYLIKYGVLEYEPNHFLEEVDHFLLLRLRQGIKHVDFGGFSNGIIGHGLYFLERARFAPERFAPVVTELVQGLMGCCVTTQKAAHWYPDQPFRMALWNGQAAIILFLTVAAERKLIEKQVIYALVGKAIDFLFGQFKMQPQSGNLLSFQMGDLGIGYAMLRAGQVFENSVWCESGLDLLGRRAGFCLANEAAMKCCSILTGAAGAAMAFEKIYQLTGTALFGAAAELCFARLVPLYEKGRANILVDRDSTLCFGTGIAGVGTALIKSLHRNDRDYAHLLWMI